MLKTLVSFDAVSQLAATDLAYARNDDSLKPFLKYTTDQISFQGIIKDKAASYTNLRPDLVNALKRQYSELTKSPEVEANIEALLSEDTFTVVTAHQPSLFLGPCYFIYKAINTINLANAVSGMTGVRNHIVPIFVIGSEDHDLDELNHTQIFSQQLKWDSTETGPVGSISTASIKSGILEQLRTLMGDSPNAQHMMEQIDRAYNGTNTVSQAVQSLMNDLFGRFGLLVLDMNDALLKRHFIPIMQAELLDQPSEQIVQNTIDQLGKLGFKTQAAPRNINLFYLQPGKRERIVLTDGKYTVLNTGIAWTKEQVLAELQAYPERFSPNVVLRPLFQELILPNIAYVGGGGELAYWMERKSLFEHFGINFPLLVRRNSLVWIDRDLAKKIEKLGITPTQIFEDTDSLIKAFVERQATSEINLNIEKERLNELFASVSHKAERIDATLKSTIEAESIKQMKALEQLESRIVRAEKQKHQVSIGQIRNIRERLFPANSLQERTDSFLPFYLRLGDKYFDTLLHMLRPLEKGFVVLVDQ
jgi:bacillithiol synthase